VQRRDIYTPDALATYEDTAPRYNTATINRYSNPEDASLAVRCLMVGGLPELGPLGAIGDRSASPYRGRAPGGISIFYDVARGQAWQRTSS